mmetsp:Transcript_9145/g.23668  ORF Transcript_9145/g.23668 Transcript_9145/m.23668 type:complete len:133 (+) Transcript_9145:54-452(+)
MSFSRIPDFDGSFREPDPVPAAAAGIGMALVSWLHLAPTSVQSMAPWLHKGCMALLGNSSTVLAVIFYCAWLAHLGEACYALVLLQRKNCLRSNTALPWFISTFLFGYPSLKNLIKDVRGYRTPKMPNKRSD